VKISSSDPPGCFDDDLGGQIDEGVAALGEEHVAQLVRPAGSPRRAARARPRELRLDDGARLVGDGGAERHVALHGCERHAVVAT
jgi:hypothetical protein